MKRERERGRVREREGEQERERERKMKIAFPWWLSRGYPGWSRLRGGLLGNRMTLIGCLETHTLSRSVTHIHTHTHTHRLVYKGSACGR